MIAACVIHGLLALLFLFFGLLFARGKGRGLIAGYNTMSERERAKYDEKKLLRIMRNGMFALAGCMVVGLVGTLLQSKAIMWTGHGLLLAVCIVLVICANTRTKRKE